MAFNMNGSHTPTIYPPCSHDSAPLWQLSYPALIFLKNDQNYTGVFGMMGLLVMSKKWWIIAVS